MYLSSSSMTETVDVKQFVHEKVKYVLQDVCIY